MSMDSIEQEVLQFGIVSPDSKIKVENFSGVSHKEFPHEVVYLSDAKLALKEEHGDGIEKDNQLEEELENPERRDDGGDFKFHKTKKRSIEVLDEFEEDRIANKKLPVERVFIKVENLFKEDIKNEPSDAFDETHGQFGTILDSLEESNDIELINKELEDDPNKGDQEANDKKLCRSINLKMKNLLEKNMKSELSDVSDEATEHGDSVSNSFEECSNTIDPLEEEKQQTISRLPFPDYDGRPRTSNSYIKLYSGSTLTNMAFVANERAAKAKRADQKPKVAESIKLNILEEAKANFISVEFAPSAKQETCKTEIVSKDRTLLTSSILSKASLKEPCSKSNNWIKPKLAKAAKAKSSDQKAKVAKKIKSNILEEAKANFISVKAAQSAKNRSPWIQVWP